MPSRRQLAAIMFTDIVGYTAMMQQSEQQAVSAAKRHQELLEACVLQHEGEVLHYYGDGSLTIFKSAVEAVQCAMKLQRQYQQPPKVPLRIGIHIGEVMFDEGKVFGDGVNIASRIESLGLEGAVLFSRDVAQKIRNLPEFQMTSLGEFDFKNVDHPLEVFALANEGFPVPKRGDMDGKLKSSPKNDVKVKPSRLVVLVLLPLVMLTLAGIWYKNAQKPGIGTNSGRGSSIAVLPFRNLSGDPGKEYFSDGITSEIISELAHIDKLSVISETSILSYKNSNKITKEIAEELGVDLIVEGNFSLVGDQVRIIAQLIDAKGDRHLSAFRYNELFQADEIFEIQIELAKKIAEGINIQLSPEEKAQIESIGTKSIEAYDLYLRAKAATRNFAIDQSNQFLKKALEIDPNFSQAYTLFAWNHYFIAQSDIWGSGALMSLKEIRQIALPAIDKAIALNPEYADAYLVKGALEYLANWDFEAAEQSFQKGMAIASWADKPTTDYCTCAYTSYLALNKRLEEAMAVLQKSKRIDPANILNNFDLGIIYFMDGRIEKAIEAYQEGLSYLPEPAPWAYLTIGTFYYHNGQLQEALENFNKAASLYPEPPARLKAGFSNVYHKMGQTEKSTAILDELYAQKNRGVKYTNYPLALIESERKNYDKALELLEEAYREEDYSFTIIAWDLDFKPLEKYERYRSLLKRIGYRYLD